MTRFYTIHFVSGRVMVCKAESESIDDIAMRLTGALPAQSVQVRQKDHDGPVFVCADKVETVSLGWTS